MGNLGKIIVATGSEKCNKLPNLVTLPVSYKMVNFIPPGPDPKSTNCIENLCFADWLKNLVQPIRMF